MSDDHEGPRPRDATVRAELRSLEEQADDGHATDRQAQEEHQLRRELDADERAVVHEHEGAEHGEASEQYGEERRHHRHH